MEKQKKKLTISGKLKKTFVQKQNFESKKKISIYDKKFPKPQNKTPNNFKKSFKPKPITTKLSDYERRKLAEQKAMKGIRGENIQKDKENKSKFNTKKRETKLTVSRALSEDLEFKSRSLASIKRAREKELRVSKNKINDEISANIKRDINIPEFITIRDLANRMAEQSSNIIKHLMGMGVAVTINHTIDSDTAEYLVKEFGHNPIREKRQMK